MSWPLYHARLTVSPFQFKQMYVYLAMTAAPQLNITLPSRIACLFHCNFRGCCCRKRRQYVQQQRPPAKQTQHKEGLAVFCHCFLLHSTFVGAPPSWNLGAPVVGQWTSGVASRVSLTTRTEGALFCVRFWAFLSTPIQPASQLLYLSRSGGDGKDFRNILRLRNIDEAAADAG